MIEEKQKKILLKQLKGYIRAAQLSSKSLEGCLEKIKIILKEIRELEDNSTERFK